MWRSGSTTRPILIEKFDDGELWLRKNVEEAEKPDREGGFYLAYEYDETMTYTSDSLALVEAHFETFWTMCEDGGRYANVDEYLRTRRQNECFAVVDRPLWLDSLTPEKLEEIKAWRVLWLDVTNTLEIPVKPHWL